MLNLVMEGNANQCIALIAIDDYPSMLIETSKVGVFQFLNESDLEDLDTVFNLNSLTDIAKYLKNIQETYFIRNNF